VIAFLKAIPAIVQMVNYFFELWFDISNAKITNDHTDKRQEMDALMKAVSNAKNDNERVLLARSLNRIRQL
jgi:hypothetical protein